MDVKSLLSFASLINLRFNIELSVIPQGRYIDSHGGDGHQVNTHSWGWEGSINEILDAKLCHLRKT